MVSAVQKSYRKNILREMKGNASRMVSLFGIVALGVMMLTGLMSIAPSMRSAAQKYYVQQNVFDLRVLSTLGLSEEDIAASGLDYLALGHIHQGSGLRRAGRTFWAYPGCPEGRGFDELGEKGILTGTVERGKAELSFVPFARRRYEILNVDVTGRSAEDALRAALPDATVRDIYRIIFTGETDERGLDLKSIEEQFAPDFFHLELRDETRIGEDVWARAQEDSLRGLFLRELRTKFDVASSDDERAKISLAARFGLAALDGCDL